MRYQISHYRQIDIIRQAEKSLCRNMGLNRLIYHIGIQEKNIKVN